MIHLRIEMGIKVVKKKLMLLLDSQASQRFTEQKQDD